MLIKDITLLTEKDAAIQKALAIYNSNRDFLIHHLAVGSVDQQFIEDEVREMVEHDFISSLVFETASMDQPPLAVLDYQLREDGFVYLSLLMVDAALHGKGKGTEIYHFFEGEVRAKGAHKIRIDVVDEYETNPIPFWEKMGFRGVEHTQLTWGDKTSSVVVMVKEL